MRYLLDTTVFIDVARRHPAVTKWLGSFADSPERLATSVISVAEFFTGLPPAQRAAARKYLRAFTVLPISFEDAVRAGEIRWEYRGQGVTLGLLDALQGALAERRNLTIATSNARHFPCVPTFDPRHYESRLV